jgi:drug/metabolite transporter (DMT)-like permease
VSGTVAAGLFAALLSTLALNWGYFAQHEAAAAMPRLTLRRPLHSLRLLFARRRWLAGFLVGIAGWVLYVGALRVAPLSLVQAVSAGGIGVLAILAWTIGGDRPVRRERIAVVVALVGLVVLALSVASTGAHTGRGSLPPILAWVGGSVAAAVLVAGAGRSLLPAGVALGSVAGLLYAAGDVVTKAAVGGGARLGLVALMLACHGLAFVALQLGFQRGGVLATAGLASLFTNAVPIVAGVALFGEGLPPGLGGAVRVAAFAAVVVGGAGLARADRPAPDRGEPYPAVPEPVAARLVQTSETWS